MNLPRTLKAIVIDFFVRCRSDVAFNDPYIIPMGMTNVINSYTIVQMTYLRCLFWQEEYARSYGLFSLLVRRRRKIKKNLKTKCWNISESKNKNTEKD